MARQTILSDALLKQLMAVGQVDILVGLPTLDNAATVVDVVRAVHASFTRDFVRPRTVMINSDAGSIDGTPELIRNVTFAEGDVVQTSHALRTMHRVVTPYHGLPGKRSALRTLFAAAALTQARTLVVIDPAGPATTADRVTELITPIHEARTEFLAPRYRRHPRDGALITQLVRPLVRAVYGIGLDEPLGAEFACSGRFASHCLDQSIWNDEGVPFAIDLWLRTEAIAHHFPIGQIWRPASTGGAATTLREAVRQIYQSLLVCLHSHEKFWRTATDAGSLITWGQDGEKVTVAADWDYESLRRQAQHDIGEIRPLLEEILRPALLARLLDDIAGSTRLDDELWVHVVYALLEAASRGTAATEHLANMMVPLYAWRASGFMAQTAGEPAEIVQHRLNELCTMFQRFRPELVNGWAVGA